MDKTCNMRAAKEQNKNTIVDSNQGVPIDGQDQQRRRELNDRLRMYGAGGFAVMTDGVAALGPSAVNKIFERVAAFDNFTPDNDPWGEHDCALVTVDGIKILWKIDYFDRSRRFQSPEPSDFKVTIRVMTVMRADEY